MKRLVYHLVRDKGGYGWRLKAPRGRRGILFSGNLMRKRTAISESRAEMRKLAKQGLLLQLVVHADDGRILFENTYPRSSDPRRTKG